MFENHNYIMVVGAPFKYISQQKFGWRLKLLKTHVLYDDHSCLQTNMVIIGRGIKYNLPFVVKSNTWHKISFILQNTFIL